MRNTLIARLAAVEIVAPAPLIHGNADGQPNPYQLAHAVAEQLHAEAQLVAELARALAAATQKRAQATEAEADQQLAMQAERVAMRATSRAGRRRALAYALFLQACSPRSRYSVQKREADAGRRRVAGLVARRQRVAELALVDQVQQQAQQQQAELAEAPATLAEAQAAAEQRAAVECSQRTAIAERRLATSIEGLAGRVAYLEQIAEAETAEALAGDGLTRPARALALIERQQAQIEALLAGHASLAQRLDEQAQRLADVEAAAENLEIKNGRTHETLIERQQALADQVAQLAEAAGAEAAAVAIEAEAGGPIPFPYEIEAHGLGGRPIPLGRVATYAEACRAAAELSAELAGARTVKVYRHTATGGRAEEAQYTDGR